jgi:thiol-disulfide isomerase/thioredoxin
MTDVTRSKLRGVIPTALTAAAVAFIAVRFMAGAHETLTRTRDGACQALDPAPVPAALASGPPDFQLPDANGKMVSLVNFWATWCQPCIDEVPSLEELARKLKGTDLRFLAVSVDDSWEPIRRFFSRGTDIGVLLDTKHDVPKSFGTEKYPESFMIDAQGRVRYYFINKRDWSRAEAVTCLESLR